MAVQQSPIHRALVRPELLGGCEREPVIALVGFTVLPLFPAVTNGLVVPSLILGAIPLIGVPLLRKLAKSDPKWFQVYRRHLRYRRLYSAHSTPYRLDTSCPNFGLMPGKKTPPSRMFSFTAR